MSSATLPLVPAQAPRPVASTRHTLVLMLYLVAVAAAGAFWQHGAAARGDAPAPHPNVLPLYLSVVAGEWALVWFVWRGARRMGVPLRELIGGRFGGAVLLRDVVLAAAMWGVWWLIGMGFERLPFSDHAASVSPLLPKAPLEIAAWVLVSCSAGFSEELVFRGYFQRQFAAWTGSAPLAVLLQAVFFGVTHAYQGVAACMHIAVYGALFGAVALWRRSLRPGMIAHAATDILAGLFRV